MQTFLYFVLQSTLNTLFISIYASSLFGFTNMLCLYTLKIKVLSLKLI